jgi:acyl-coenzyme A thioesterase PaaI-like protein|tara:strand:- start:165 stop:647 length:483 start_codon:yes stop_codon:yes gene_type:complete
VAKLDLQELFQNPELLEQYRARSPAHNDLQAELSLENGEPRMNVPYQARFARSVTQPTLHAGIVMMAIDSAMGLATLLAMEELSSLATLELRYDELRCPEDESSIAIEAKFESLDGGIAYLSATALDTKGVFAKAVGRFILMPGSTSFLEASMGSGRADA